MAKSRAVRKLDQKRATSFTESGTDIAFGDLHAQPAHRYVPPAKPMALSLQEGVMKAAGDLAGSIGKTHADGTDRQQRRGH